MLSDISVESKEKSVLIYKIFKIYFVEIEKKWAQEITKNNEKVDYYKKFCAEILTMSNTNATTVEAISEVLLKPNISEENLSNHKKLIKELLTSINSKKKETYLLESEIEILKKELNFWLYDFEHLKLDNNVRVSLI